MQRNTSKRTVTKRQYNRRSQPYIRVRRGSSAEDRGTRQSIHAFSSNSPLPKMLVDTGGPTNGAQFTITRFVDTINDSSGLITGGDIPYVSSSAGAPALFSMGFELDDFLTSDVTNLKGLFDQYRIDEVDCIFLPSGNTVEKDTAGSTNRAGALLAVTTDRDDASAPASWQAVLDYGQAQVAPAYGGMHVRMVPSLTPSVYASGAFSGYVTTDKPLWLDLANSNVPYYGIKGAVQALDVSSTNVYLWNILLKYRVSFRKTR